MDEKEKFKKNWGRYFKGMIESKERMFAKHMEKYPFVKLFQGLAEVRDGKVVSRPGISCVPVKFIDASFQPACAADTGMDDEIVMIHHGPDNRYKDRLFISVAPNPEGLVMPCQVPASWYFLGVYLCHDHMGKIQAALIKAWDEKEEL